MTEYQYPTEEALARIRAWPRDDFVGLMEFVKAAWWAPDWGWTEVITMERGMRYEISTGGWSGNEEIMAALRANFPFWTFCWQLERRGGHYEFEVPACKEPT